MLRDAFRDHRLGKAAREWDAARTAGYDGDPRAEIIMEIGANTRITADLVELRDAGRLYCCVRFSYRIY